MILSNMLTRFIVLNSLLASVACYSLALCFSKKMFLLSVANSHIREKKAQSPLNIFAIFVWLAVQWKSGILHYPILTYLTNSKGALVACVDLTGTTSRKIKQLDESGNHLILLFCVTKASITSKTPAEHTFLRVQHKLPTQHRSLIGMKNKMDMGMQHGFSIGMNRKQARKGYFKINKKWGCLEKTSVLFWKAHIK